MMTFPYASGTPRTTQHRIEAFTDDPATELSEMATRLTRFTELGIPLEEQEVLDDIATEMASRSGFLYGMVNAFGDEQRFLGLHNPPQESGYPIVGRTMPRNHGWCPEVIQRRRGLPLPDVAASPRFQGNPVVDGIGIQSYFGSPLIDEVTGLALATVCIIDSEPRPLGDAVRLQNIVREAALAAADVLNIPMPRPAS
ncbi:MULTISPECIES: GAF domain-containing protein [unclassified Streptomyces]|uniref:GAF domain-containing protein n=1 Tax=unclassified Streptomyces TaxID=2593676 RepID=UPI00371009A9